MDKEKTIHAYKGFDKDLRCKGFQYEVGKSYEQEGEIECCMNGFHACKFPFAVFRHYVPGGNNRYCSVTQSGEMDEDGEDFMIASSNIHIEEEIGIDGIIEAGVKSIHDDLGRTDDPEASDSEERSVATNKSGHGAAKNSDYKSGVLSVGDYSLATAFGYYSLAANTGDCSVAKNIAFGSVSANAGYYSAAINDGYCSIASNAGHGSVAVNKGRYSAALNTGADSVAMSKGFCSVSVNAGCDSAAISDGLYSVAVGVGRRAIAKVSGQESIAFVASDGGKAAGALGDWIVLTERGRWDKNNGAYGIKEVKAFKVDGEKIKADTFYKLVDGEAVEA